MNLLAHTRAGAGVPVVFIHGFCESKDLWKDFIKPLTTSYSVICVDLPNFGESAAMPDATMEKMAEAVIHTLNHLKIDKCVLVGHSLGGYVGLAVAELYPERLLGLCLFHSTAFEDSPERKEGRNNAIANIQQNGVEIFVRALIPSLFSPSQKEKDHVKRSINLLIENAKNSPTENIIDTLKAMRDRKERIEVLKNVDFPILFLVGKDDAAVPLTASMAQCYLPKNAQVHIWEQVGHKGMIEVPEQSARSIARFVDDCL